MLNMELARIVVAERRRETEQNVRQGRLREALAERKAVPAPRIEPCSGARPGSDPQFGPRAALG